MKYSIFGYLIGEGFRNFFKNKKSTAASIIIMCATMFIFGIFFLIGENINYVMDQVQSQQAMQAFINPEATEAEEDDLYNKIMAIPYVNTATYVSQEEALNTVKGWLGDSSEILDPYSGEDNPFKASYVITLTDLTKSDEVQAQIESFENVTKVEAGNVTINRLIEIANGIRTATGVILVLLILISIFIIANTIKLTVHARRKRNIYYEICRCNKWIYTLAIYGRGYYYRNIISINNCSNPWIYIQCSSRQYYSKVEQWQ